MDLEKAISVVEKKISEYDLFMKLAAALRKAGSEMSADFADMDVHYAKQDLLEELSRLSAIVGHSKIIEDFERESGEEFDVRGPLPVRCSQCGKLTQFRHSHELGAGSQEPDFIEWGGE
jgi:hypothetical protein